MSCHLSVECLHSYRFRRKESSRSFAHEIGTNFKGQEQKAISARTDGLIFHSDSEGRGDLRNFPFFYGSPLRLAFFASSGTRIIFFLLGTSLLITSAVMIANFRQLGQNTKRARQKFFVQYQCLGLFLINSSVLRIMRKGEGLIRRWRDNKTWIPISANPRQESVTHSSERCHSRTGAIQKPILALSSYFNPVKVNKFIFLASNLWTFSAAVCFVLFFWCCLFCRREGGRMRKRGEPFFLALTVRNVETSVRYLIHFSEWKPSSFLLFGPEKLYSARKMGKAGRVPFS